MTKYVLCVCAVAALLAAQCGPSPKEFYHNARVMEEQGDFLKALELIEKAIEKDPENAEYIMNRGYYLSRLSRVEEAIQAYKKSYKLDDQPHVAYCLSELLAGIGRYKEAEPYSIVVVSGNTGFVPAVKLLTEIELALWKTENARQCIEALDVMKAGTEYLKKEMDRRNSIIKAGKIEQMRGIRNHLYLKTGTVMTGTGKDAGTGAEEALFTVVTDSIMSDVTGKMIASAEGSGVPIQRVVSFPFFGGNVITDALTKTAGAKFLDLSEDCRKLCVWICMENYSENRELKELISAIKSRGGCPYIFAFASSRPSVRRAEIGPDIAGIGGVAKIDTQSLSMQTITENIVKFLKSKETYTQSQNRFYSGIRSSIRIKEKR